MTDTQKQDALVDPQFVRQLSNPSQCLFGMLSQKKIDTYQEKLPNIYDRNRGLPELEKTMKNSLKKYNKHKNSASKAAVHLAREMGVIGLQPALVDGIGEGEEELREMKKEMRGFRPK